MIGIFGGTFDPIHQGHIDLAQQAREQLSLSQVQLMPCANPVHRPSPRVSASNRLQMLELAIANRTGLQANRIELDRGGASYMVDSLREMHARQKNLRLCLLVGTDSFNHFHLWKSPAEILQLAHLVVCRRPGLKLNQSLFAERWVVSITALAEHSSGSIFALDIEENTCSSSCLRQLLGARQSTLHCLPKAVSNYIHQHHLYERLK